MKILPAFKLITTLFLIMTFGCEEIVTHKTFPIGREFSLRMNETLASADGMYILRITDIDDSRCPQGVQCIWEGEVIIKGEWTHNKDKSTFEVHSVIRDQNKQPEGFIIEIKDVKPYPKYGTDSNPEDMVITLLINEDNGEIPSFAHLMKGWELYNWAEGNDWKFSILPGTNRLKTYQEVITNKTTAVGIDALKLLLDKFPKNEYITWIGKLQDDGGTLSLPDQAAIDEIKNYARQKELELNVVR